MDDIAPYLLEEIQKEFDSLYRKNKKIQKLLEIINSGKGTYEEANEYAIEVGEILAKCYSDCITEEILPDAKMYYNIAKRTIEPTMQNNFDLISIVSVSAQEALNQKANIGLAVKYPEINQYKIDSIINKLTSDQFNKVAFILQEPVAHFSQSIVDDTIKANAELHSRSGLHPKITRKVRGGCCKWCMNLAGTYAYPDDVPDDVYRRHDHCRCEVLYDPGEGKQVQNVHTKSWENQEEDIQRRIEFSTSKVSKYAEDVTAEYFGTAKPGEGSISYDNGYDVSSHKHEVQMANFLFEKFGVVCEYKREENIHFLHPGKSAGIYLNDKNIGFIGCLHPDTVEELNLKTTCYIAEIDFTALIEESYNINEAKKSSMKYKKFSRFPSIQRDLALIVKTKINASDILKNIAQTSSVITDVQVFDVFEGKPINLGYKSIAVRITFTDMEKTLRDEDINPIIDDILKNLEKEFEAVLR